MILSSINKVSLAVILLIIFFAKELIIINQEFFIILAFLLVFFSMKHFLGDVIKDELNARQTLIINNYLNLEKVYQQYLNKRLEILRRGYFLVFELTKILETNVDFIDMLIENRKVISKAHKTALVISQFTMVLLNMFTIRSNGLGNKLDSLDLEKLPKMKGLVPEYLMQEFRDRKNKQSY